jgi:hypothetical protein
MFLIQVLLPVTDMAGGAPAELGATIRELADKFEGLTAYTRSPAKGLWTAPDGHTERDDVVLVEIVTDRFDRGWWQAYQKTLAERFAQKEIHVRAFTIQTPEQDQPELSADGS